MKSLRDEIRFSAGFGLRDLYGVVLVILRHNVILSEVQRSRKDLIRFVILSGTQ